MIFINTELGFYDIFYLCLSHRHTCKYLIYVDYIYYTLTNSDHGSNNISSTVTEHASKRLINAIICNKER